MSENLSRRSKSRKRYPKLAHYLLITDTNETEKNYFEGLKASLPKDLQKKIDIQIVKSKNNKLLEFAIEQRYKAAQYVEVWIVIDRDRVPNFDQLIDAANAKNINVAWTNPCIEEWFFAYFTKLPVIVESKSCCAKFCKEFKKKTGEEYKKSDKKIYKKLNEYGDEKKAIERFNNRMAVYNERNCKPSKIIPGGNIQSLVRDINKYKNK